jgi:hypothetical protein
MMEVRVADLSDFQATLEIEPSSTIADLRAAVARQFPFDPTNCLVCHEGKELMDSEAIPTTGARFFVFFDTKAFPVMEYPTTVRGLPFLPTRWARVAPPDAASGRGPRRSADPHGPLWPSDWDSEGDYELGPPPPPPRRRRRRRRRRAARLADFADSSGAESVSDSYSPESESADEWESPQPRRRGRVARWLRPGESGSGDPGLLEEDGAEEAASPTQSNFGIGAIFASLTDEELQMVRRLARLGFAIATVIQVFDACGRDENATQACLMSEGFR